MRRFLRAWLPPVAHRALGRVSGHSTYFTAGWSGWRDAAAAATGYDAPAILARVVQATREVEAGRAAFERDSVTFKEWQPRFPLVAALLRHALQHGAKLDVVDFGGALGSSYRLCKPFLPQLADLRWQVIEQPHFVEAGRREFSSETLSFYETLEELPQRVAPRIILACSSLQYLADPDRALNDWNASGAVALFLDRTPVWEGSSHMAVVQTVPHHIYPGSYPCWLVSRSTLMTQMAAGWRLVSEFDCDEGSAVARRGPPFEFRGFLWDRAP